MAAGNIVNNVSNDADKVKYQYSKVNLSLENCILPIAKLSPTPSQVDGLDSESEVELRILGCELIQTSGILLRLPQVAMATGQVLFQRFYFSKSFVRHTMEIVAMACITLASKIEEAPRRIRDVINVFHHIKQVKAGKTIQPLILDQNYINMKNQVIKAERRILKELGFCVHVKHPHKIIVTLLEVLKVKNQKLMQTAWNYMNDSLRTEVFVLYDPETIACGCIHLSALLLQIPLPNKPSWFLVFDVNEKDINDICQIILSVYTRKKPDSEKLEKVVEELRKTHQEAKLRAKGLSAAASVLANFSPVSQSCSPRNGKSPNEIKKDKNDSKHNDTSPKGKDVNHKKRRSRSPVDDGYPTPDKRRGKTSSSGSNSSHSQSPKRKQKTPPRGFKDSHRSRSRSHSKSRSLKKSKHRSSHKRKHSRSVSPSSSPLRHSSKKSYKAKHSEKERHVKSRSRSRERNHHSTNSVHEKTSHKSRKERVKENHHSRDKKRR